MGNTKKLEEEHWSCVYEVKAGISLQKTHEWRNMQPTSEDNDEVCRTKQNKAMEFLLEYVSINPKIDKKYISNDDVNGSELTEVYDQICILYRLVPSISREQLDLMKSMDAEQRTLFLQDIQYGRMDDIKKKLASL
jgi:hypothetical protein